MNVQTLVELLSDRAQQFKDKHAFNFVRTHHGDVVSMSYGQLHAAAMKIAAELQSRVGRGDRAWLLFPPGLESIAAFFGCLYAGVVAVPLSPPRGRRVASSLRPVLEASEPALVLTTSEHLDLRSSLYADVPQLFDLPWIASDRIPEERGRQWKDPGVNQRDVAFLQYTSGSTAAPKGVIVSHENLLHNSSIIRGAFRGHENLSAVFWLPLYHDMGLIGGVIQPIYCGGSCTLLAPAAFLQHPLLWLETISSCRAAISGGPDFGYDICARKIAAADRAGLDLSCWQVAFTGAEPIRAGTLERFASAFSTCGFRPEAFLPVYGLAEATLMVSGGPRGKLPTVLQVDAGALAEHRICEVDDGRTSGRQLVASGTCLPSQRVVIVDPETRRPRGRDEVGEIWVQGGSIAQGYFRQPEVTNRTFQAFLADSGEGPFLRTGDLGFIRGGQLFVTGRLKDLIIIRGRNYYPEDIELIVEALHPGFRAGHCVAFPVEVKDQERLVVVQELEPRTRSLEWDTTFQAVRQAISAAHEVDAYSIVLAKAGSIPKTTSGKRRRALCRDLFLQDELEVHARWTAPLMNGHHHPLGPAQNDAVPQPTAKEIEVWLVQRIAGQLGIPTANIHVNTPFLELGMDSLAAMEVAGDLQKWLNRRLSPTAVYNYPSIASLAAWLANSAHAARAPRAIRTAPLDVSNFDSEQLLRDVQKLSEAEMTAFIMQEMAQQSQPQ